MHALLRGLVLTLLLLATPAAAQEIAGKFQLRYGWDRGPWDIRLEQQIQTDLLTPGGRSAFEGIDFIANDEDDNEKEDDEEHNEEDRARSALSAGDAGEQATTPTS